MARLFSLATAWISQAPPAFATTVLSLAVAGAALLFALALQMAGLALIDSGTLRVALSVALTALFVGLPLSFLLVSYVQRSARAEADAAEDAAPAEDGAEEAAAEGEAAAEPEAAEEEAPAEPEKEAQPSTES